MPERFFDLSPKYGLNDRFELFYGPGREKKLNPCREIKDPDMVIGIVDNNQINVKRLLLVNKDRTPLTVQIPSTGEIVTLGYPGKSAFINFSENRDRKGLKKIVNETVKGNFDRRDHLHCACLADINEAGWRAYWAPLQMSGILLHVRLVCDTTIKNESDPQLSEAVKLKDVFRREC